MEEENFGISINEKINEEEVNVMSVNEANSPIRDMDLSVFEYKTAEKGVREVFIKGVIKLGEILYKQREVWRPMKRWTEFLDKSKLTMTTSNQMIRIYKYAKNNFEKLQKANVTNWSKINLFLALSDVNKDNVANKIDGEEVEVSAFKEVVNEFKEEVVLMESFDEEKLLSLMNKTVLKNVPLTARILVRNVNKEKRMSPKCSPLAEAFLYIQKSRMLLDENYDNLNAEDVSFWRSLVEKQINTFLK